MRHQNVALRLLSFRIRIAIRAGGSVLGVLGGATGPRRVVLRAVRRGADVGGDCRAAPPSTSGTSRRAKTQTSPAAQRQPGPSASCAIAGRNTSCPVELAAENTPTTTPRCRTNHRLATIAPKTRASAPVPMPTANPHSSHSCHGAGHHQRQAGARARPAASATATTRRMPNRSIRAAANGAVSP